ncbi:hypothetical protein HELRODRAFT_192453 [Helobdella robusta]|uniref:Rad21/Rec8-like protein N-terminal domain-containing protein n=1 Tax=Helobdella robusta TaxID=6412 RepID=T1FTZ4_HELRO|nr:hypothetical protein HELRODRAFT_192453 [Helobdella robusta]ESO00865.1 hypothetical protein HELRODRAFT_192453 [Helobdella robusta]
MAMELIQLLAATKENALKRRDYEAVDLNETCSELKSYILHQKRNIPKLSLYLSSQLLFGAIKVYRKQVQYLLVEATELYTRLKFQSSIIPLIDLEEKTPRKRKQHDRETPRHLQKRKPFTLADPGLTAGADYNAFMGMGFGGDNINLPFEDFFQPMDFMQDQTDAFNQLELHRQFTVNPSDITLKEDVCLQSAQLVGDDDDDDDEGDGDCDKDYNDANEMVGLWERRCSRKRLHPSLKIDQKIWISKSEMIKFKNNVQSIVKSAIDIANPRAKLTDDRLMDLPFRIRKLAGPLRFLFSGNLRMTPRLINAKSSTAAAAATSAAVITTTPGRQPLTSTTIKQQQSFLNSIEQGRLGSFHMDSPIPQEFSASTFSNLALANTTALKERSRTDTNRTLASLQKSFIGGISIENIENLQLGDPSLDSNFIEEQLRESTINGTSFCEDVVATTAATTAATAAIAGNSTTAATAISSGGGRVYKDIVEFNSNRGTRIDFYNMLLKRLYEARRVNQIVKFMDICPTNQSRRVAARCFEYLLGGCKENLWRCRQQISFGDIEIYL